MANRILASARISLVALALAGAHLACGVGKDNEERFLREMRDDIDRTQSDGYNTGDEMDHRLVGTADPRGRARGVASPPPPPPPMAMPEEERTSEPAQGQPAGAAETGGAAGATKSTADEGEVLSFTNANIAAALASYSAKKTGGVVEGKSGAAKKGQDAGTP
jgi:hypothetical protein